MKNKFLKTLLAIMLLVTPLMVSADAYTDKVAEIMGKEQGTTVKIYLFRGNGCPHCERALNWIEHINQEYRGLVESEVFEVWEDESNRELCYQVKEYFGEAADDAVPFIVIGEKSFMGFDPYNTLTLENTIREYIEAEPLTEPTYVYEEPKPGVDPNAPAVPEEVEVVENVNSNKYENFKFLTEGFAYISATVLMACASCYIIKSMKNKNHCCEKAEKLEEKNTVKEKKKEDK